MGHEKTQVYRNKVIFFLTEKLLKAISNKNYNLSNDIRLNIINEVSNSQLQLKFKHKK